MGLREAILARDTSRVLAGRVRPDVAAPGDVPPYVIITTDRASPVHALDGPIGEISTVWITCVGTTRSQADQIARIVVEACESEGLIVDTITTSVIVEAPESGTPLYVSTVVAELLSDDRGTR